MMRMLGAERPQCVSPGQRSASRHASRRCQPRLHGAASPPVQAQRKALCESSGLPFRGTRGSSCTYLGPDHVKRVYFEFLVRHDEAATGLPFGLANRPLVAEGCEVHRPRYPLLHKQPLFTEGTWRQIARLPGGIVAREYSPEEDLPRTQHGDSTISELHRLRADRPLLDQYIVAFQKVVTNAAASGRAKVGLEVFGKSWRVWRGRN